jgi:hypothetical protein
MKKSVLLFLCAGTMVFGACSKTEKKETDTATVTENTGTESNTADYDTRYRERAGEVTTQMSQDLNLDADTATQSKLRDVYYSRAKRRHETRSKYTTDTTGMYAAMKQIDMEADQRFQSILKPEQYQTFESKRTTYYGGFEETNMPSEGYNDTVSAGSGTGTSSTSAEAGTSGTTMSPNAKVKTKTEKDGDTKTEIEDGKTETKIKTDAKGHTKVKTNTKK